MGKKKKGAAVQTDPPTVPVKDLFPSGQFPEGQIMEHPIAQSDTTAKNRFNSEEARAIDRLQLDMYNEEAADTEEKSVAVEIGASENNGLENTTEDSASSKKKKSNKKKKGAAVQTDPPTVPVKDLFPSGQFPEGQIMEHPIAQSATTAKNRFNSEEARAIDRL